MPVVFSSCTNNGAGPKDVTPDQLYSVIETLISRRNYSVASSVLRNVRIDKQIQYALRKNDLRWVGVQQDTLSVPGLHEDSLIALKPSDLWIVPGTSDTVESIEWQTTATEFAKDYNELLKSELEKLRNKRRG
jgi:hypothetical protein